MKTFLVITLILMSASNPSFGQVKLAPVRLAPGESQLLSCQDGEVLLATSQTPTYAAEVEILFISDSATYRLRNILSKDVLQGLDHNRAFAIPNDKIIFLSDQGIAQTGIQVRFMQYITNAGDLNTPAPAHFRSMVSESRIFVQQAGREVPLDAVGKKAISPGFYASMDHGNTLNIQFFRTSNDSMKIPGLSLGVLSFTDCH